MGFLGGTCSGDFLLFGVTITLGCFVTNLTSIYAYHRTQVSAEGGIHRVLRTNAHIITSSEKKPLVTEYDQNFMINKSDSLMAQPMIQQYHQAFVEGR